MIILEVYKKRGNIGGKTYNPSNIHINMSYMNTTSKVANIPVWQKKSLKNLPNEIWKYKDL